MFEPAMVGAPLFLARCTEADDPKRAAARGVDHREYREHIENACERLRSLFSTSDAPDIQTVGAFQHHQGIEKVQAMFAKVGPSLGLVSENARLHQFMVVTFISTWQGETGQIDSPARQQA